MNHVFRRSVALIGVITIFVTSCSTDDGRRMQEPVGGPPIVGTTAPASDIDATGWKLTAPWEAGGEINIRYTCDGEGISPPLVWGEGPEMTRAYGIVLTPQDDPSTVLWALADIPIQTRNLVEGLGPDGAIVSVNASGALGYQAPCPDAGISQQFEITVYAQEFPLESAPNTPASQMRDALQEVALDAVSTTFTHQRR
jgi:phosphatidylethanolamine-binding protein (PEBP) family uncharacterized protein